MGAVEQVAHSRVPIRRVSGKVLTALFVFVIFLCCFFRLVLVPVLPTPSYIPPPDLYERGAQGRVRTPPPGRGRREGRHEEGWPVCVYGFGGGGVVVEVGRRLVGG